MKKKRAKVRRCEQCKQLRVLIPYTVNSGDEPVIKNVCRVCLPENGLVDNNLQTDTIGFIINSACQMCGVSPSLMLGDWRGWKIPDSVDRARHIAGEAFAARGYTHTDVAGFLGITCRDRRVTKYLVRKNSHNELWEKLTT